ncbi:MAG: GtrA family protein [Propionibacteriaceae bacterium]|jgi:putative flippase GtrA|nr:GtrA family protein [Propionibacteriaceae bacterium]
MPHLIGLAARQRANFAQFIRFGLVGGSGVIINFLVYYIVRRLAPLVWPSAESIRGVVLPLPWAGTNIRWYHVFSMAAFVVANVSNYQLNRIWTFRSVCRAQRGWWSGFGRFFLVGLLCQLVGLAVETALLHAHSPIQLPPEIFNESTGLRNPGYWAHLIMIAVTIPMSFLFNKIWTFRGRRPGA